MAKKFKIRGIIGLDESATPGALELFLDDAGGQPVSVEFNTPGGFVYFGLEMANMIKDYPGHTTAVYTGLAASMGSYMPMAFDKRVTFDNAIFMVHNPMMGAFGIDYRGAEKLFTRLKAIRDLLGKAYSFISGKSTKEMNKIMDDETFLYGQEIVDAGFADEILKSSDKDKTKDSAVALAEGEIISCLSAMKASDVSVSDDFERAAAFINKEVPKPPAAAGKPNEEAVKMSLKELLAADPDAKAEHDAAINTAATTARAEGETAGKTAGMAEGKAEGMEQMKTAFKAALPILTSASYPETVKERVTEKAIAGDNEGLKDFVAMHDMNVEKGNENETAEEIAAETLAQGDHNQDVSADGMINSVADLDAAAAMLKTEFGVGGTN